MRPLVPVLLLAATTAACVPDGLAFRVDERVSIVSPEDRAEVALPVTISWEVDGFDVEPAGSPVRDGAGYFAVFVDRAPIGPGKAIADGTDIYTTSTTEVVLESLPALSDSSRHTATIVLVDGSGHRIGESAFDVTFRVVEP